MPGMMDTVLNIGLNDETAEGMIKLTGDARFVYDSYRRLVQMFGSVVMGVADEPFEEVISEFKKKKGIRHDVDLDAEDWKGIVERFKALVKAYKGQEFPQDPYKQLEMATRAVFNSWFGKRAIDYRNATNISHDLGTAVNIVTMVFGNMGDTSATGVAFTRNPVNGDAELYGDFLINAQGEDVVAGIRNTLPIAQMKELMPAAFDEFMTSSPSWKTTSATCRTWSSRSSAASCGCSRPATASAPPAPPSRWPWTWPTAASSTRKRPSAASRRNRWTCCCTRSSAPPPRRKRARKVACS
jgi:phosphoenolpyruvate synthase/pyruvate phosphate dikinase